LRSECKLVFKFIQRALNWEIVASSKYIPSIWSSKSSYSSNVPQKPHESSIFQQRVEGFSRDFIKLLVIFENIDGKL
jgi:hypothetical protein